MGYSRAGFEVVGVDLAAMPRNPFPTRIADALTFPLDGFDVVHASPPCQAYSRASRSNRSTRHPDLVDPIRQRLADWGGPYVIENVVLAPLRADLMLCGTMFGLPCRRHRLFESNVDLGWPPFACGCERETVAGRLFNLHNTAQRRSFMRQFGYDRPLDAMRAAYGVPWMGFDAAQEAIPPAYTEHIGRVLRAAIA